MHTDAPGCASVSVVWPAGHKAHGLVEKSLYRPAAQTWQRVAAIATGISWSCAAGADQLPPMLELLKNGDVPAKLPDCTLPAEVATHPAGHTAHATVEALLYWPAAQAVHVVLPTSASVSVIHPFGHTAHATVEALLY